MDKIPVLLKVSIPIETKERELIFDAVLEKYFQENASGHIILAKPDFHMVNNIRNITGFAMDILLYNKETGIDCIKRALTNLGEHTYELYIMNKDQQWVLCNSND